ncbi:MAG: insulinase family protein [Bacteroidetes bacterium]|nr:insulinase family protein [Bacteroidota bacterium]MBP7399559.1 insulinase family protein [Chitinophagales bacterium]MBK8683329.1 insulinase family protein [Bacteroidota bacterium]MBP8754552.1 insulinase family protein [Chitinophagales bacterium]MBP9190064.1 insulinase family protein [Chitinophagales bacterium]
MLNRKDPPALELIDRLEINNFKTTVLSNNTPVYIVDGVEEEVIKIEWRFNAGRWYETQPATARTVLQMMRKGTLQKTAEQIADAIEFYGGDLDFINGQDSTGIVVFCLKKHLDTILPIVIEILQEASFPEPELEMMIQRQKQKLRISEKNTDFYANRAFHRVLFGETHPYGYAVDDSILDNLNTDVLKQYHQQHYKNAPTAIFISGNVSDDIIDTLNTHYGKIQLHKKDALENTIAIETSSEKKVYKQLSESVQSSIRIGKIAIPRTHPDFLSYNIMMVIFGGYFGSRLMSNIREEKGYTYGIHATTSHNRHASYMEINTEVGNEVCEDAIEEIYKEMDLLRNEKVSSEELSIVRNYMMGSILRATDGPFNRINIIKNLVLNNMDTSYYDAFVNTLKTITPEQIQVMANKYLVKEEMKEVICGNLPKT